MQSGPFGSPLSGFSADVVAAHATWFSSLPDHVRRLEQRERAAQKSAEVKARQITRLEEQVQRYVPLRILCGASYVLMQARGLPHRQKNEIRALQESLALLKARR